MTPEGRVKARITDILNEHPGLYQLMVVPSGYGKTTLDYICCFRGLFFSIEAKRLDEEPTGRQKTIIRDMCKAQGVVFVIDGEWGYLKLKDWLADVAARYPDQPTTPISKCPISLSPQDIE
jgi:hypothetical protein